MDFLANVAAWRRGFIRLYAVLQPCHEFCYLSAITDIILAAKQEYMPRTLRVIIFIGCASLCHADVVFNFESNSQSELTPFTDTVNGLSATFSGPGAVCDVTNAFVSLSGNALTQQYCETTGVGALKIAFSQNLGGISFDFATDNGTGTDTVTLRALKNGAMVGSVKFVSIVPPGSPLNEGEGVATFSGLFNGIEFSSDTNSGVFIDNVAVRTTVPEPGTLGFIGMAAALFSWTSLRRSFALRGQQACRT